MLSLSASCRQNSPAEKVVIAGWIFGWRSLGKAQQALCTFLELPYLIYSQQPNFLATLTLLKETHNNETLWLIKNVVPKFWDWMKCFRDLQFSRNRLLPLHVNKHKIISTWYQSLCGCMAQDRLWEDSFLRAHITMQEYKHLNDHVPHVMRYTCWIGCNIANQAVKPCCGGVLYAPVVAETYEIKLLRLELTNDNKKYDDNIVREKWWKDNWKCTWGMHRLKHTGCS